MWEPPHAQGQGPQSGHYLPGEGPTSGRLPPSLSAGELEPFKAPRFRVPLILIGPSQMHYKRNPSHVHCHLNVPFLLLIPSHVNVFQKLITQKASPRPVLRGELC